MTVLSPLVRCRQSIHGLSHRRGQVRFQRQCNPDFLVDMPSRYREMSFCPRLATQEPSYRPGAPVARGEGSPRPVTRYVAKLASQCPPS